MYSTKVDRLVNIEHTMFYSLLLHLNKSHHELNWQIYRRLSQNDRVLFRMDSHIRIV